MSAERRDKLTEEQRVVVELPVDARAFVVAGPGTGKTHLLVHRLADMTARGIGAGEVLVLSFTNAVVGEFRRRLSAHGVNDVTYVRPTTIDSFAGRIVARSNADPTELGFDATVRQATAAIDANEVSALIAHLRHVIVDEAQDLVGPRLDFVATLLRRSRAGFTVLGDPAQGIYGFADGATGAATGIDALRAEFPEARVARLTHQHRSLHDGAAPGQELREVVTNGDARQASIALRRRLHDCDRYAIDKLLTVLRRAGAGTAVLCRTNGEALLLSDLLAEAAVAHRVRRSASANVPPRWVAELLGDVSSGELSRATFGQLVDASEEWTDRSWMGLRRTAPARSGGVDMSLLRERLLGLKAEEAPTDEDRAPLISTVHRAKGLEYDTVVVLEPARAEPDDADDEARILYVAMTRARRRTVRLDRPEPPGRLVRRRGRWALAPWQGRKLTRIELRPGDVDPILGPGRNDELHAEQQHLRDEVRPGDAVTLRLDAKARVYDVWHGDRRIGSTTETFASFADPPPARIERVRIDCVRSAVTDPARTANLGLGGSGFFLSPELVGLGCLQWEDPTR